MPLREILEEGYCRARLRTIAKPMPLFAPVTRAIRELGVMVDEGFEDVGSCDVGGGGI